MATKRVPIEWDDVEPDHEYAVQYLCDGVRDASFTGTYTKFLKRAKDSRGKTTAPMVYVFELDTGTEVKVEPQHRKCIMPTGRKRIDEDDGEVRFVEVERVEEGE